ncbi:MAG: hypothetical protein Q9179_007255, partial [Wetmoreana sp. 5 TL-2023]
MPTATASPPLPLTFGLEFEHLLAFHESLLTPLLPPNTRIIKSIPYPTRIALRQTTEQYLLTRPQYIGWALTSPSSYPSLFGTDWHNDCLRTHGYRGYADEILQLEKQILEQSGCDVVVHDGKGKMRDFKKWHLTTDTSLVGATREELASALGDQHVEGDVGEWDSSPVELVSRVLPLDDEEKEASFTEIAHFLDALKPSCSRTATATATNEDKFKVLTTPWCGLHVHIGLPPSNSPSNNSFFPLPLLQHLAYITLIYEPVLSSLHPRTRRPGNRDTEMDLDSCRGAFYEEPDFAAVNWDEVDVNMETEAGVEDSGYASDDASVKSVGLEFPLPAKRKREEEEEEEGEEKTEQCVSPSAVARWSDEDEDLEFERRLRKRARKLIFARDMTVEKLCELMSEGGQKGCVVNWTYLSRPVSGEKGPRTIEFRQHEACLELEE